MYIYTTLPKPIFDHGPPPQKKKGKKIKYCYEGGVVTNDYW